MTNLKRITVSVSIAIIAALFLIGAANMDGIAPLIDYVNIHTNGYMASVFYTCAALLLFLFPIIVGAAVENLLWDSNTSIGKELSTSINNARNGWVSFIALGLSGGMVTLFSVWGFVTVVCG